MIYAQQKPVVQDIQAQYANGTRINVFWRLPENPKPAISKLRIYRATKPITSYSQIEYMEPLAELSADSTGYTDYVEDFNDYFYAVISCTEKPYDLILVSMNATVTGVHINAVVKSEKNIVSPEKERLYADNELRETPLPYIDFVEGINKEQQISSDTTKSVSQFNSKNDRYSTEVSPYYFEEDLISPDGGDDFILFEILKTTFVQEKYDSAIEELQKITSRNINQDVQNRAYFYMAEALFFTGHYDDAVKNFIVVANAFPQQTKKWINIALDKMIIPQ